MAQFFNRQGEEITRAEHQRLLQTVPLYSTIKVTAYEDGSSIQTTWVGVDMSLGRSKTPMIFVTTIYPQGKEIYASSETSAIQNHLENECQKNKNK
jgi:hypothetical protein